MLQRPQTICFSFAALLMVSMAFVPIWGEVDTVSAEGYALYAWYLQPIGPGNTLLPAVYVPYMLIGILAVVSAALFVYQTFRYDDRKLQMRIAHVNSIVIGAILVLLVAFGLYNSWYILPEVKGNQHGIGLVFTALSSGSIVVAEYFIIKDEKMVESSERIR